MGSDTLLCSTEEAAQLLGIGRSQLFELLARAELESVKIGRRRLVPRDALGTYVERLRAETSTTHGNGDAA
jgi:excisionase family DNA binding protein